MKKGAYTVSICQAGDEKMMPLWVEEHTCKTDAHERARRISTWTWIEMQDLFDLPERVKDFPEVEYVHRKWGRLCVWVKRNGAVPHGQIIRWIAVQGGIYPRIHANADAIRGGSRKLRDGEFPLTDIADHKRLVREARDEGRYFVAAVPRPTGTEYIVRDGTLSRPTKTGMCGPRTDSQEEAERLAARLRREASVSQKFYATPDLGDKCRTFLVKERGALSGDRQRDKTVLKGIATLDEAILEARKMERESKDQ